jgi:hypothetical protein
VYGGTSVAAPLVAGVWALTGSLDRDRLELDVRRRRYVDGAEPVAQVSTPSNCSNTASVTF